MMTPLARRTLRHLVAVAGILSASACLAQERVLSLHNMNTGEAVSVVYKRDGAYDREGLKKLDWFLRDWRRDQAVEMDRRLYDTMWEVYRKSGAKAPIEVHSGYRSPATNRLLRKRSKAVARHSQHMSGTAIDFHIPGVATATLREIALKMQDGGVGYYPGAKNPFIHVDVADVRHWPRMSRVQLSRLFPDGRTLHLPSDGRPLKGFKEALASIKHKEKDFLTYEAEKTYAVLSPDLRDIPLPQWRPEQVRVTLPSIASAELPEFPVSAYVPPRKGASAFDILLAPSSSTPSRIAAARKPLAAQVTEGKVSKSVSAGLIDMGTGVKGPRLTIRGRRTFSGKTWKISGYL